MPLTSNGPGTSVSAGTFARLSIAADRAGACVRLLRFIGLDMTGWTLAGELRLAADTPGPALVALAEAASGREGFSLAATYPDPSTGAPVSEVTLRLAAATMLDQTKIPYAGELGDAWTGAYAIVGTPPGGDTRTLAQGAFIALPTTFGANNAPANRPADPNASPSGAGAWDIATLTFSTGAVAITIDGAPALAPLVAAASASAALATAAVALFAEDQDTQWIGRPVESDPVAANPLNADTWVYAAPVTADGHVSKVQLFARQAGNVTIASYSKRGSTLAQVASVTLPVAAGLVEADAPGLAVAADEFIGVEGENIIGYINAPADSGGAWPLGAAAGGDVGAPVAGVQLQVRIVLSTHVPVVTADGFRNIEAAAAAATQSVATIAPAVNKLFSSATQVIGRSAATDPAAGNGANDAVFVPIAPAAAAGRVSKVELYASAAGIVTIATYALAAGALARTGHVTVVVEAAGPVTFNGDGADFTLPIAAGEFVGLSGAGVLTFNGAAADTPEGTYFTTAQGGALGAPQPQYRFEWRITLSSSVQTVTADAFAAVSATARGGGTLTLADVEKVVLVSNSYGAAGETLRGKAPVAIVSGLSEYNFGSYTLSGQTAGQLATMITTGTPRYGGTFQQLGARWAIISENQNGKITNNQTDAAYYAEQQKLIDTVRGCGARAIVATEWGLGSPFDFVATTDGEQRNVRGLRALADANGAPFWDVTSKARRTNPHLYGPFFKEGHPSVRTGYMITDGYLRGLRAMPRPRAAMKLFRVRGTVAVGGVNDLLFRTVEERWRLFREIAVGQASLGPAKEATYDQATDRSGQVDVADEYMALAGGAATTFGSYALIDCVLPVRGATGVSVTLSDTACTVYARRLSSTGEAWVQLALAGGVFVVPDGAGLVDQDRLALLATKSGDVSLNASPALAWAGGVARAERWPQPLLPPTGPELLAQPLTVVAGAVPAQWINAGGLAAIVPVDGANNLPGAEQTPPATTGCVEVTAAAGLSQAIVIAAIDDPVEVVIRVWARRWVPIFTGTDLSTAPITYETCDTATLLVTVSGPSGIANASAPMRSQVGLAWTEIELRTTMEALASVAAIDVRSADATIQIARVSVRSR